MKKLLTLLTATILVTTPVSTIVACGIEPEPEEFRSNWITEDAIENLGNLTFEEQSDGKILLKSDKFEFTKAGDKEILISKDKNLLLETKLYGQTSLESQWNYEIVSSLSINVTSWNELEEKAIIHHNKVNDNMLYVPNDILLNNQEGVHSTSHKFEVTNDKGATIALTYRTIFYDFIFSYICEPMKTIMNNVANNFNKKAITENWVARLEARQGALNFSGAQLNDRPIEEQTYFSIIADELKYEIRTIIDEINSSNHNSKYEYLHKYKYEFIVKESKSDDSFKWIGVDLIKNDFTEFFPIDTRRGDEPTPIRIPINTILK